MSSVTEVLDYSAPPPLVKWFKNNSAAKCEKIAAETSAVGQQVDTLIQMDIDEGGYLAPEGNESVTNCLAGWEKLKKDHPEFVPSVKEMQAEVAAFGVIGHFDYRCEESGTSWGITDLKCTSAIREKNWIQIAAYAAMLMIMRELPMPSFLRVIRLKRDAQDYEWLEIRCPRMIRKLMNAFHGYAVVFGIGKEINEFFRAQNEELILGGF